MEFQYALRFESGERRGEVVPISIVSAQGGTFTIGRKPGNSLQVTDPSVSGRHAELEIASDRVGIRDLDSTNGTKVGGERVRQASLGHMDDFVLGAVEFTLLDNARSGGNGQSSGGHSSGELSLEDPDELVLESPSDPPAPRPSAGVQQIPKELSDTRMQPRDEALEITADDLARSRKSSMLGPILVVVLAAVGGGVWWWLGQRSDGDGRGRVAAVEAVSPPAGNLLSKGYSFERSEGWSVDESLAATFDPTPGARNTGRRGVRAEMYGGEAALLESDPVRPPSSSRAIRAEASVRGDADAAVRLGLRYSTRDGSVSTVVWSEAVRPGEAFETITLSGVAPAGVDEVRVLVRGDGVGRARPEDDDADVVPSSVDVDDVALVPDSGGLQPIRHEDWSLAPTASADGKVRALSVTALDRLLVSSIRVTTSESGLDLADLTIGGSDGRITLETASAGQLVVRAESDAVAAGVATMGEDGYAAHGTSFDRPKVDGLLVGADSSLVRLAFSSPLDVAARPAGDDLVVRADVAAGTTITVQVEFAEERTRAETLARRAQDARRAGDSGGALRIWSELLAEVPFDQRLVDLAAKEQGELIAEGRAALRALDSEIERARFFRLADLYREKLARIAELGDQYEGSAIEAQCNTLADSIRLELAALDADRDRYERMRLEAIEAVLRRDGAEDLASRMDEYMAEGGGR